MIEFTERTFDLLGRIIFIVILGWQPHFEESFRIILIAMYASMELIFFVILGMVFTPLIPT